MYIQSSASAGIMAQYLCKWYVLLAGMMDMVKPTNIYFFNITDTIRM